MVCKSDEKIKQRSDSGELARIVLGDETTPDKTAITLWGGGEIVIETPRKDAAFLNREKLRHAALVQHGVMLSFDYDDYPRPRVAAAAWRDSVSRAINAGGKPEAGVAQ